MFVSYAQNGEDIVLWRIFRDISVGTYVDVGAADPTEFSVTRAFYDRGWSGVNVEPTPAFARRLEEERPRDHTFACAASDTAEEAAFFVADRSGLSTLDASLIPTLRESGYEVEEISVPTRTLDDILSEAGLDDQPIHFLKIDVEGAEAQVLAGLDLDRWRPWVLVVESTEPNSTAQNHEKWDPSVVEHGYTFCLFDGLNRFYVANEHPELVAAARFPVSVFDYPYRSVMLDANREADHRFAEVEVVNLARIREQLEHEVEVREEHVRDVTERIQRVAEEAAASVERQHELERQLQVAISETLRWRADAMRRRGDLLNANDAIRQADLRVVEASARAARSDDARQAGRTELDAVLKTLSWRVTKPLRVARRIQRRGGHPDPDRVTTELAPTKADNQEPIRAGLKDLDDGFVRRFCGRLAVISNLLDAEYSTKPGSLEDEVRSFQRIADRSQASVITKAWLAMVAVMGTYPDELILDEAARTFRRGGGHGLGELILGRLEGASHNMSARESQLEVVRGGVLVDVTHTAAHDLHTGIQRVVREVSSRWLADPMVSAVQWNFSTGSIKQLADDEATRLRNWRTYLHDSGTAMKIRTPDEKSGKTLIPWGSVLVLPELVANPPAASGLRALSLSGVVARCSLIGYDTVPITATETVTDGMTANFAHYLALVKHSTHLAAISQSAATEFRAFGDMLRSQGLTGPKVTARPLPTEAPNLSRQDVDKAREEFDVSLLPVVVVVGSHEPRKNHVVVLEAAESMWRSGHRFDLVFAGGSSWGGSTFVTYLQALAAEGFPVRMYERVNEQSLWALYGLAEFSVFPSLLEGYGLPIAESLASGTPVITSNHGSMAEVGKAGGVVLVDPRDSVKLASAMTSLLVDKELRDRLTGEARARVFPTWDQYSDSLWADLVGTATKSSELL